MKNNTKLITQEEELKNLKKNNIALAKALTEEKMNVRYQFEDKINIERRYIALRKKCYQLSEVNKKIISLFENTVHTAFENYEKAQSLLQQNEDENKSSEAFLKSEDLNFNVSESANSLRFHNRNSEVASVPSFAVSPMISGCMIQRPTINLQRINITTIASAANDSPNDITQVDEPYMNLLDIEDGTSGNEETSEILNPPLCNASSPLSSLNEEGEDVDNRDSNSSSEITTQACNRNILLPEPVKFQIESSLHNLNNNIDHSETIVDPLNVASTSNLDLSLEDSISLCANNHIVEQKGGISKRNVDKSWKFLTSKVNKRSKPSKKKSVETMCKDLIVVNIKNNKLEEVNENNSPNLKKKTKRSNKRSRKSNIRETKLLNSSKSDFEDTVKVRKRKVVEQKKKCDSEDSEDFNIKELNFISGKRKKEIPKDDARPSTSQEFSIVLEKQRHNLENNIGSPDKLNESSKLNEPSKVTRRSFRNVIPANTIESSLISEEVNSSQTNKLLKITRRRYELSNSIIEFSTTAKEVQSPELNKVLKVNTRRSRNMSLEKIFKLDISNEIFQQSNQSKISSGQGSESENVTDISEINKEESLPLHKSSNVFVKCKIRGVKKLSLPSYITSRRSKNLQSKSKDKSNNMESNTMNESDNNQQSSPVTEDYCHKLRRLRRKDISYKEPNLNRKLRR